MLKSSILELLCHFMGLSITKLDFLWGFILKLFCYSTRAALRLFLFVWLGGRYDSRRLVMVTSSSEGTMMPLEMLLAIAWLRLRESVLLVT